MPRFWARTACFIGGSVPTRLVEVILKAVRESACRYLTLGEKSGISFRAQILNVSVPGASDPLALANETTCAGSPQEQERTFPRTQGKPGTCEVHIKWLQVQGHLPMSEPCPYTS